MHISGMWCSSSLGLVQVSDVCLLVQGYGVITPDAVCAGKASHLLDALEKTGTLISARQNWTQMDAAYSDAPTERAKKKKSRGDYEDEDDDVISSHKPLSALLESQPKVHQCLVGFVQIMPNDVRPRAGEEPVLYHPLDALRIHPEDYERAMEVQCLHFLCPLNCCLHSRSRADLFLRPSLRRCGQVRRCARETNLGA